MTLDDLEKQLLNLGRIREELKNKKRMNRSEIKRLCEKAKAQGYNLSELARILGISRQALHDFIKQ